MPARQMTRSGPEMPASLLIDLHRDPERYEAMVNEISAREGSAREAEASAGKRIKAAESAEAKALEAEGKADAAEKKAEAARERSEAAKVALGAKQADIDAMHAAAVDRLQAADELTGRVTALLMDAVAGFDRAAAAVLAEARKG